MADSRLDEGNDARDRADAGLTGVMVALQAGQTAEATRLMSQMRDWTTRRPDQGDRIGIQLMPAQAA